ncbi:hypothetical protein [Flavobacterium mesophilum]|uniref:hypothetical protein n=1 Tax=Flavobacterium mesophilum TaxID=3143495 RepID=UPI0031D5A7CA
MSNESSSWRTVLSIVFVVISAARLLYTCSDMNRRQNTQNTIDVSPYVMSQQQANAIAEQNRINSKIIEVEKNKRSNNLFYSTYSKLDSLTALEQEDYGVYKLKKDTLVFIDIKNQLSVPKEYYFQNNHDDSLRFAIKSPRNLTMFVHDFETKDNVENSFKSIKKYSHLQKLKVEKASTKLTTLISYQISKENKKLNGYAFAFQRTGKDYVTFFEFESATYSPDLLKEKALEFLLENLKLRK